jgi:membrane-associated phospholipid phosphatase
MAPTAKFCSQCGTRAGEDAPATGPVVSTAPATGAGMGAERRVVSVLFADLVGFTTLAVASFPELAWLLIPLAALIAASRVVLGLHYPSDVAAGALIGAALAVLSMVLVPLSG